MRIHAFTFSVIGLLLTGCGQNEMSSVSQLIAYWNSEENGLLKRKEHNDLTIELSYKPKDLILAQEIEGLSYSNEQIDSIRSKFKGLDYMILKLSKSDKEIIDFFANDPIKFGQALEYLSFKIGNDVTMLYENENIPVEAFIYSRSFGSSNASSILLAFKSSICDKSGAFTVLFDDSFFGTGLNRFNFKVSDIQSIPSLDLNNLSI